MMRWLRADLVFPERLARLVLTRRCEWTPELWGVLRAAREDPDEIERAVRAFIARRRPDLAGGSLLGIQFDFERQEWEFLYAHPSLFRATPGAHVRRTLLVDDGSAGDEPPVIVEG